MSRPITQECSLNNLKFREDNLVDKLFGKFGMAVVYMNGYSGYQENCSFLCSVHGEFSASPKMVLRNELGCGKCGSAKMSLTKSSKERKFKNTISDLDSRLFEDTARYVKIKDLWTCMLERCYGNRDSAPTYKGCSVSNDWLKCSKFFDDIRQFENYEMIHNGWQLDKDILVKGNKVYSKDTCCIVPQAINTLFTKAPKKSNGLPVGVRQKFVGKKYTAQLKAANKRAHLGSFIKLEDAFQAYKEAKESYIKEVAEKWKDKIDLKVYNALISYEVEITD